MAKKYTQRSDGRYQGQVYLGMVNGKRKYKVVYGNTIKEVDKQIKSKIGEREKIITGQYLIERKSFVKKSFTVPESVQYRIQIKRL